MVFAQAVEVVGPAVVDPGHAVEREGLMLRSQLGGRAPLVEAGAELALWVGVGVEIPIELGEGWWW